MESNETLSQFLTKLNILYSNLLEFYNKFGEAMNSNAETVTTYQLNDSGAITEMKIPSIGYYTNEVRTLHQQIESLVYANGNQIALQYTDGSVKRFDMQQMSHMVQSLESVGTMSFQAPVDFRTKTNWFFESFLNPLMVVNVNVAPLLTATDIQKFAVRRVLLITSDESQNTYFDQSIKGRTDLDYYSVLAALDNEGIGYHVDDNIVDLPFAINRYRGSFTVVSIVQQNVTTTDGTEAQMIYKLDKLTYTDISTGSPMTVTLAKGDTLVTSDDTEYEVLSTNKTDVTVTLVKKFGIGTINIGANQLRVRPVAFRIPELQVNVGYNEREIIFVSPISSKLDMATDVWSKGFAIYTNDLKVTLSDGTVLDMSTYYKNFVSDFGMMFMSYAKDRQVPSTIAMTPNAPSLDATNFKVLNVNTHLKEDKSVLELKAKISAKEKLENELDEINKVINKLKSKLNDSTTTNDIEKMKIKKDIDQNLIKKNSLLSQLTTTIQEITLGLKTQATFKTEAKYRVRGFWDMPDAKDEEHGSQSVVQFKIMYRYISKKGTAANVQQIPFVGNTGQEKYGFFSNWNEQVTKVRRKIYDNTKGIFVWADENLQDPESVNINQLDIAINKGEAVEIRVKSISEAGFPINPAESEWSSTITIPFPDDIEATEEDALLAERMFYDSAVVKFQQELNAKGLDVHLLNSLYTGDKYLAHKAEEIASGYYTPEGKIKDMFMVIKEMKETITAMETAMKSDYGDLMVTIIDSMGNVQEVKNGTTISLFAGFYKDLVTDSDNNVQHGEIVTSAYTISIQNTSATTLELASRIIGGIAERAPSDESGTTSYGSYPSWISGDGDYTRTRVYDKVPIVVTASSDNAVGHFKQRSPQSSGQVCGQYIFGRYREYGMENTMYFNDDQYAADGTPRFKDYGLWEKTNSAYDGWLNGALPYTDMYLHDGKKFTSTSNYNETPANGYMYMPYNYDTNQTANTGPYGSLHPEVWNGSTTPIGNGPLSEFCIHTSHPALLESKTLIQHCLPAIDVTNDQQSYIRFAHALHFNTTVDEKTDIYGAKYWQQCKYRKPVEYTSGIAQHANYPIKNGFNVEDTYLVGKYTCGSYLFMAPNTYTDIVVDGTHPKYAKKDVKYKAENSINIPVVFQFRCSDKLGYIGGYRRTGDIQNVKYAKKIGIDIYERDMTKKSIALFGDIFSFDIEVSCQYSKTTNIITPIMMPQGNLSAIRYSSASSTM